MNYQKYESSDFDLTHSFIKKYNSQEISSYALKQGTSILALDEQGSLIALGLQWRNELHDRTIVIEICVLPERRREGIGSRVFNKLIEEFPARENDFSFDIRCESENDEAQLFVKSLGFEEYLSCYHNIFNIDEMKVLDTELEIITLSKFYSQQDKENRDRVRDFHCSMYDRDHEPFLPLNQDKEVRHDYYSDGDLKFGAVIVQAGRVIGCSFAYLNFEKELAEETKHKGVTCLHGYASDEDANREAFLVQALYSFQMSLLKKQGLEYIYIEFDSIERISDLMIDWLPHSKAPMLRFEQRVLS